MIKQRVLWTATRAAQATGGTNTADWAATGLSINTRTLSPGDLFIALTGPNCDGHDFVKTAFDKGASAAVVHRPIADLSTEHPLLQVTDSFVALQDMAVAARADSRAKFVGITGSVGKTTVKNALAHCLGAQAPTSASQASFNNHWGVPFSLCTHQPDAIYALNELGMSAAGEIRALSALVRPDIAIITTIAPAHMAAFQSLAEVAAAKSEIFDSMVLMALPSSTATMAFLHRWTPPHVPAVSRTSGALGGTTQQAVAFWTQSFTLIIPRCPENQWKRHLSPTCRTGTTSGDECGGGALCC